MTTVTRSGDLNIDATVEFGTIDGAAVGASLCGTPASPVPFDYDQAGGTLFFSAGVTELTIQVTTCNNNPRGDTNETFEIEIYIIRWAQSLRTTAKVIRIAI